MPAQKPDLEAPIPAKTEMVLRRKRRRGVCFWSPRDASPPGRVSQNDGFVVVQQLEFADAIVVSDEERPPNRA